MVLLPARGAVAKTLNLIFVHQPTRLSRADVEAISLKITALAPEIKVIGVLPSDTASLVPAADWERPTVTVSFGPVEKFIPLRGPLFENRALSKLEQFRRLRAAGINTPHTAPYRPAMILDEKEWGPFVIMKPSDIAQTSNGEHLQIFRTGSLSGRRLPEDHASRRVPMLLQQWIDSGDHMTTYRCLTLFGAPLICSISRSLDPRPALDSPDEIIEAMKAESDRGQNKRWPDQAIMDFGSRMAGAFPRHPILGCDVIVEAGTGRHYAIEVNAGGNVWHFSSPRTAQWRTHDANELVKRSFASFDVAARALVRKTREEAR